MKEKEYVQYIVVRKDLVPIMGIGKTAAQVAHGSLGVLLEKENGEVKLLNKDNVKKWIESRFVKLVVGISSKQKLLNLLEKLDELGIRNKKIFDACRTKISAEEENGSTLTCAGIEPILRTEIPKCLAKLQLLD